VSQDKHGSKNVLLQNEKIRKKQEKELSKWLKSLGLKWNGQLGDIKELKLSFKQLTSLPESIGLLSNLEELDLAANQLTNLPDSFGQLSHLQKINLAGNQLTSLPDSFGQLSHLEKLNLHSNKLLTLPKSLSYLSHLKELSIGNNQIKTLPDSLSLLHKLEILNIQSNEITIIPEFINQLTKLSILDSKDNQLTSIPEYIGQLSDLKELHLARNHIESLPHSFGRLSHLNWLNIEGNPITNLSVLQLLPKTELNVFFLRIILPRRYWTKLSEWQPEWLLDTENAEIRRVLIQQLGYEKICERLGALPIDNWREYTLLKIDRFQPIFDQNGDSVGIEPMVLLKMTCPSTGHIHILRVPPEMTSAEAAITWVNHGIHPDKFAVQTRSVISADPRLLQEVGDLNPTTS
jgi:leucine-rich repeat protein SHOC2